MNQCKQCTSQFEVADEDRKFYEMMGASEPTLCPDCRFQRRVAWRNERHLYQDKCDLCERNMVSLFSPESKYTVYCQQCWWSDKWNPMEYGRDFDFNRPFFEQFAEMMKNIPMCNLQNAFHGLENSEYVNYTSDAKNCYLVFATNYLEDCMYSSYIWESKDVLDCSYSTKLELCYQCIDCDNLYNCKFLQNSKNSSDCILGYELHNCKNCFGCVNLKNKEYHFFNEQLGKDEYVRRVEKIINNENEFYEAKKRFYKFSSKHPKRYVHQINCQNSTGDGLKNCKNCHHCFDGYGGEDLKWMINFPGEVKDCYDISGCAKFELGIECHAIFPGYNVRYTNMSLNGGSNMTYCGFVDNGNNLFGCIGTKRAEYAILNKKYSKEEYETLTSRIIEHMKNTGEWGEFFPIDMSPFSYNETVAQEHFPLKRDQVLQKGWKWSDYNSPPPKADKVIPAERLPSNIKDIPDDILSWAIECAESKKPFKITPQELRFYRKTNLFIPKYHPDIRHLKRLELRNPRKLWDRKCDKCQKDIKTSYSPERPEKVYCEECYLKEVY
jgi:hypothetical protein